MNIFLKISKCLLVVSLLLTAAGLSSAHAQGKFWGLSASGGNGYGALFNMNADGTGATVLYSFTTLGGISGYTPSGSLDQANGLLYGVARVGGSSLGGTLFSYDTAAGVFTKLHDFATATGSTPYEGPTAGYEDGKLYGVTYAGGNNGLGVIYSFDPSTAIYTKLVDMVSTTGGRSFGRLTLYHDKFYGLSYSGGTHLFGTFFCFDPVTNTVTNLQSLTGNATDGFQAGGNMVVYNDVLYGVNTNGGGELFSYDDGSNTYTSLHKFTNASIYEPCGIVLSNNIIYGIAYEGGPTFYGGIFSYDPATATYGLPAPYSATFDGGSFGGLAAYNGKLFGLGYDQLFDVDLTSNTVNVIQSLSSAHLGNTPLSYAGTLLMVIPPVVGTTPQTITFNGEIQKTYGDADFDPGATASSQLRIKYTSSDLTVAKISGTTIHIVGAGSCTITASQAGNSIYAAASDVSVTLTVNPAPLLIAVNDTVKNQLMPNPVFRITYTGFVNGEDSANLLTPAVATTTADDNSPQGSYPITLSGATSNNYAITFQNATLTIIGQYQSISFGDMSKTYGDADFDPGATATSGLLVTYISSNPAIAAVNANETLRITGAGTDTITSLQAGDANWAPASQTRILTVTPASLTITVDNKTKVFGQTAPAFTAVYNGLTNGDNANNIGAVFTSAGALASATPGDYFIDLNLGTAANINYNVITYKSGVLTVTPVEGVGQNSMDAYFSSLTGLQVNTWMTADQTANLQVYNMAGQCVITQTLSLTQGYNTQPLPAAVLPAGVYIVRLTGNNLKLTKTIRKIN